MRDRERVSLKRHHEIGSKQAPRDIRSDKERVSRDIRSDRERVLRDKCMGEKN